MAFTTWAALKQQILDDIADGSVMTKSYTFGGRNRVFRDLKDAEGFLNFIDRQIDRESRATRGGRVNLVNFG